jgi:glycosyltransferase involved in cell wall biosynthesis
MLAGTDGRADPMSALDLSATSREEVVDRRLRAIGVVVPAHNEEALIEGCLQAVAVAASRLPPRVDACVVVVLDACNDRTSDVVEAASRRWQADPRSPYLHAVESRSRNVGAARQLGCQQLLQCWARVPADRVWLASTDADSTVAPNWLAHQVDVHAAGNVGWVGTIEVADHGDLTAEHLDGFRAVYRAWDGPIHPHVHGTNLGIRADAYRHIGGFSPLPTGEDHDLLARLSATGLPIARSPHAPVLTSTRTHGRAPAGFAGYLHQLRTGPLPVA